MVLISSVGSIRIGTRTLKAALMLAPLQPCCSFTAIASIEPNLKSNAVWAWASSSSPLPKRSQLSRDFSSSTAQSDRSHERPFMYQLEHIQKRLEFTVPLIFKMRPDYTFFRKDVVLDDQILQSTKSGLHDVMNHIGLISTVGKIIRPHIELQAISIIPILEDGTVRLRWRIRYSTWLQFFNPKNYSKEQFEKILKWFDGYSVFHVDGDGLVYKWTIQKSMPDDSALSERKDKTKEFVKRVVMPSTANCKYIVLEHDNLEKR